MSDHAPDAVFFDMVHSLLPEQVGDSNPERRLNERHTYNCIQLLAWYDSKKLPSQAEFRKVLCQDLSTSGFAFYSPKQPETKFVVVALGDIPFRFYVAEVRHVDAVNNNGRIEYLVGCRLMNQITRGRGDSKSSDI